jgi:hypothetical protein
MKPTIQIQLDSERPASIWFTHELFPDPSMLLLPAHHPGGSGYVFVELNYLTGCLLGL